MPTGTAHSPGRLPGRLAGLGGLPYGKVHGILLLLVHIDTGAALQLIHRQMRELTVALELLGRIVHIPIGFISITLFDEIFDDPDDILHAMSGTGMDGRLAHTEAAGIGIILIDILITQLRQSDALLIGATDHLIIHIGEVLDELDLIAPILKVAA